MLTYERAKEEFLYDRNSGTLSRRASGKKPKVGYVDKSTGYVKVMFEGRNYYAHRVIWLLMTGEWPKNQIDHRDTDKLNNRWNNLREATPSQNMCNSRSRKDNGLPRGISIRRETGNYLVQLQCLGKKIPYLGEYKDLKDAIKVYEEAQEKYHGEFSYVCKDG